MSRTPAPPRNADLPVRTVVGLALIAIAASALWFGGFAFWLLLTVAALIMLHEWGGLHGAAMTDRKTAQYALMVPLSILSPWAAGPDFLVLGMLLGAAVFAIAVTRRPALAAGVLYIGIPVLALVYLRDRPDGLLLAFWTMALVWACDIGAYFAGRTIGGPKLAPAISPNKTWAGLLGGVVSATLFAGVLTHYGLSWQLVALTPLLAVLAQGGDLYESYLKRRAGVKDSGNVLPGHGGMLDRLDGLVPVAPVAALVVLIQGIA